MLLNKLRKQVDLNLKSEYDILYTSDIYIGNPPQKLRAMFDTGSSNTWIASSALKPTLKDKHYLFEPSQSSTLQPSNRTQHMEFGSGNLDAKIV